MRIFPALLAAACLLGSWWSTDRWRCVQRAELIWAEGVMGWWCFSCPLLNWIVREPETVYVCVCVCVCVCACALWQFELSMKTDDVIVVSLLFCMISPGDLQPWIACLNMFIKQIIYTVNHNHVWIQVYMLTITQVLMLHIICRLNTLVCLSSII